MATDFRNNTNLLNSAIHMLMRFGDVKCAERLFESIKKTDVISYGAMMKGNHL
jgi:pentatricopeptide repeat protein